MRTIIKQFKIDFLIICFLSVVVAFLNVLGGLLLGSLLKAVNYHDIDILLKNTMWTLLVWLLFYFLYKVLKDKNAITKKKMNNYIRNKWTDYAANIDNYEWEKIEVSTYIAHYLNEISMIDEKCLNSIFELLYAVPSICFSLFSIFWIHYYLGMTSIILFLVIFFFPNIFKKKMANNAQTLQRCISDTTNRFYDALNGRMDYLLYSNQNNFISTFANQSNILENQNCDTTKFENYVNCIISSVGLLSQLILVFVSTLLVIENTVSIGAILSIGNIAGTFFSSTSSAINYISIIRGNTKILDDIPKKKAGQQKKN